MENDYKAFMWSDNWWIEEDRAWFVSGTYNILFCLDLRTYQCQSAVSIPDKNPNTFRLTPNCIKAGNDIYCMPDRGNSIWIYHLDMECFSEIPINNSGKVQLSVCNFWIHDNKIYAVSNGLKQVIEIDIKKRQIENYYDICKEGSITRSIRNGMSIYSLSGVSNQIYEFNLLTKKTTIHSIPGIKERFFTFCTDGKMFCLSGYKKELYVWDKIKNTIQTIDNFPKGFGSYNFSKDTDGNVDCSTEEYEIPTFLYSVIVGDSFWFIPFQTNQILFWDKGSSDILPFEIDEEVETKESILGRESLLSKYIVEYIREDRYLGLFSIKNSCMLEIDTLNKSVEMRYCTMGKKCLRDVINIICEKNIFYEASKLHQYFYQFTLFRQDAERKKTILDNVGTNIYKTICFSD
ncbi:MAG: hypothetical protein HFJ07_19650 [Lachnospiraceae bacterium]|nr:hypothetical protein [Lachnospiraceae bacterium]